MLAIRSKEHKYKIPYCQPLSTFANLDARFNNIHINIVGPLPPSNGSTYILTCVDSSLAGQKPFPSATSPLRQWSQAFISGWIAHFGVPSTITTDRGCEFEPALWQQLIRLLGSKRIRTTSYQPIANGLVQHLHYQKHRCNRQPSYTYIATNSPR